MSLDINCSLLSPSTGVKLNHWVPNMYSEQLVQYLYLHCSTCLRFYSTIGSKILTEAVDEQWCWVWGWGQKQTLQSWLCAAFHSPPVLCYQRTLNCWEMIPAGGEARQDVEREDADRITNTKQSHTCSNTHSDTGPYCMHVLSARWVRRFALLTVWFSDRSVWVICVIENGHAAREETNQTKSISISEDTFTDAFTYSKQQCYNVLVYITEYTIKSMK